VRAVLRALLGTGLAALGLAAYLLHSRAEVARRSALVAKLARLRARLSPPRRLPGTSYRGIAGPLQCRPADFERADPDLGA